jgi:hypothetical protein
MGLTASKHPQSGKLYSFERPPEAPKWRHRLHDVLAEGMILVGAAAAIYGFVIHPLLRHPH